MLAAAREHLAKYGERVQLVTCDLLQLPFENAFDGIVSTAAFHWVLDHDRLFAALLRTLVPGGWLEAQCGGGPNLRRLRDRVAAMAATPQIAPFFAEFREPWLFEDAQGAAATLRRAGFVDVETSIEPAPTILADAAEYSEYVRNIILQCHLEKLPTEAHRARFVARLTAQAAEDDPPFSLDYWRVNLRGRK
jgi:trans-aconitate 2-methyltransferase